MHRYRETM